MNAEYRIRQISYATRLFGTEKEVKTEWVVEQKRPRLPNEDNYEYEVFCWEQITSGKSEDEAKRYFIRWLKAELEHAETAADFG